MRKAARFRHARRGVSGCSEGSVGGGGDGRPFGSVSGDTDHGQRSVRVRCLAAEADGEGGVLWEPSLAASHDHEVPVLVAKDESDRIRLVLFSYACHPRSTGPILKIGGDYPGYAISEIRRRNEGCFAVFVKGCGGDQKLNFEDAEMGGFRRAEIDEVRDKAVCRSSRSRVGVRHTAWGRGRSMSTPNRISWSTKDSAAWSRSTTRHR